MIMPQRIGIKSDNAADVDRERIVERELFATDVESIKGIGSVGTVFEQVFFGLGKFLA